MKAECDRCGEKTDINATYFPSSPEVSVSRLCERCNNVVRDVIEEYRIAGESVENAATFGGGDE